MKTTTERTPVLFEFHCLSYYGKYGPGYAFVVPKRSVRVDEMIKSILSNLSEQYGWIHIVDQINPSHEGIVYYADGEITDTNMPEDFLQREIKGMGRTIHHLVFDGDAVVDTDDLHIDFRFWI